MRRRLRGALVAAIMAVTTVAAPAAVPAQADPLPDVYTQLVNHQVPVQPNGQNQYMSLGSGRYMVGPNGLELRYSNAATISTIRFVVNAGMVGVGTITDGASVAAALGISAVWPNALKAVIGLAGGTSLEDALYNVALNNKCLGITVPPSAIEAVMARMLDIEVDIQKIPLFPAPNNLIQIWLEPCGAGQPAASSVVPYYLPGIQNVLAASPIAPPGGTMSNGAQMFIRGDSAILARDNIGSANWVQETTPGNATAIASSNTGLQMFIRGDAAVFARGNIGSTDWVQETTPGNAIAIAVGGNTQLFLRGDKAVFARSGIGDTWVQETDPGTATAIAVSSTGVQMIIRTDASVWAKTGISYGGWTQEVGPGNAAAIAVGGNTQMFLRGDSAVFAKTGIGPNGWTQETAPGSASAISIGSNDVQMVRAADSSIWAKTGIGYGGWTTEIGAGNAAAVASGSGAQMFIRGDSAVFAKTGIGPNGWTQETTPGNAAAIASG